MAASISSDEVKSGFTTSISDLEIDMLIGFVNGADACLDANSVADDTVTILKLYAVRHLLTMQANNGRGLVTQEGAASGAGRSFNAKKGDGLEATYFGSLLKQMDAAGCILALIEAKPAMSMFSVGRRAE